jgi:putative ABC transport system substrate-binding protein
MLWIGGNLPLSGNKTPVARYDICVLKSREGDLYEQAFQGLREELSNRGYRENENLRLSSFALTGKADDHRTIAAIFKQQPHYIVVIGTDAALAVKEAITHTKDTRPVPVIFLMILDPVALGLVKSLEKSEQLCAGVSLIVPPSKQFRLIKDILPKAQTIGVFYNQSDVTSQRLIETAKAEAAKQGFTLESVPVSRVEEVPAMLQQKQMEDRVQAFWLIPDVVCANPESFKAILSFSDRQRIPIIGFASTFVKRGALAALGVDFREQGTLAAEIVAKLIEGASPQEMEVRVPRRLRSSYNLAKARELGIQLPDSLLNLADEVFEQ